MWDLLFVDPITNMLLFFYKFLGQETVLAVALVTLVVRLLLTPLTINQQRSMRKQRDMQPRMKAIQEKYKNDRERLAQEQMKLYQEGGMNPVSGCLPSLIQLPLMIGLYQGIIRVLAATPISLLDLSRHIYQIDWLNLNPLIPLKSQFLWLDLAMPDPWFILPVLVAASSWLMQKVMTPPSADPQTQSMNQSMQLTMPLFMLFISVNYASGLSVYFLISNIIGVAQFYLLRGAEEPAVDTAALAKPSAAAPVKTSQKTAGPRPRPRPKAKSTSRR